MERLGKFIIRHKILIVVAFLIIIIPSVVGMLNTGTNYDLLAYMPDNLNSKQGQDILNENFGIGSVIYLMVYDRQPDEVGRLKDRIIKMDEVDSVSWIDNYSDIYMPEDFIPSEIKENFISGNASLLQIQLGEDTKGEQANRAIENIREIASDKSFLGGQAAMLAEFQDIIDKEVNIYLLIGLAVIFIILSLATTSIIEPFLLLISVGFAIILNMGSNVFLGEISYVTDSVVAIMQLAICMDYSIFLVHRYHQEKINSIDKNTAMINAIKGTSVPISGSALTTIAGFSAIMIMRMGIGKDLGFVLAKGVVFSLIVTLTLLPSLLLIFDRWIEKTPHRIFLPRFNLISGWIVKYKWVFLVIIILAVIPSYFSQNNLEYYYSTGKMLPSGAQSIKDSEKITDEFGTGEIIYVITPETDRTKQKEINKLIKEIEPVKTVSNIAELADPTTPEFLIPEEYIKQFKDTGYTYTSIQLETEREDPLTVEAINDIREIVSSNYEQYYVTGEAVLTNDISEFTDRDLLYVNILSITLVALIIAIGFKSIAIPVLLVFIIEAAIWFNLGISYFSGQPVSFMTPIFIGAIQLGATIDYAILFTSKYRENLATNLNRENAVAQTIKDTGQPIFTSAMMLFSATLVITLVTSVKATGEFTLMIGRGALISMAMIFLGLPSMLLIFDKFIKWTTWKWNSR
ncbi:MAG: hypothetical protein AVO38_00755 [delta proteobacterium ML8_D]|jgi:uncharacterized protein|nr:MAG: hypothetical protein AVO38_00755 [delta proteobacterium ML8_D]